jgi:hypothetical protein
MAEDIFNGFSPRALKNEVARLVAGDLRSLPRNAKIFSAIVRLQEFDLPPTISDHSTVTELVSDGGVELNRGISGTKGVPALIYAKELFSGTMYPGTLSALGNGIYMATTGAYAEPAPILPSFPAMSKTARKYASEDDSGIVLRAVLKKDARILDYDGLKEIARDNRNRVREAQVTDFGALAAALGFDAFKRDDTFDGSEETFYVVVNRTALTFQREVLQFSNSPVI